MYATTNASDWPASRWELPAPESHVLLHGVDDGKTEPFKLAVMELVARQTLAIVDVEERTFFGRTKHTSVLTEGSKARSPSEPSLAAVWQLFEGTTRKAFPNGTIGVAVAGFASAAQSRYSPLGKYTIQEVVPTLLARGLLRREERTVLFIFPRTKYVLTPEGSEVRADLERRIELGQAQLRGWVEKDPNRALMYAGMAGASLLLMPMVFPELGELHRRLQAGAGSGGDSGASWSATSDDDPEPAQGEMPGSEPLGAELAALDLGAFDFGSIDFGAFADMDATFSAIDAGVDSGGGDGGGGDGGGGDGGGGGD